MNTPNLLAGHFYPNHLRAKCPLFDACLVTKKCQNYNPHQQACVLCESRVSPPTSLGGLLPEGKYIPDLQDAVAALTDKLNSPMNHPDMENTKIAEDISYQHDKKRKAAEMMSRFNLDTSGDVAVQLTEQAMGIINIKEEADKYLGNQF